MISNILGAKMEYTVVITKENILFLVCKYVHLLHFLIFGL